MQSRRQFRTDSACVGPTLINGFTLIEVMIALAVMAIVVTLAFSGLSVGMDSWERGSRAIDKYDRRNTVERLLKRQLALAYPMEFGPEDKKFVLFRGTTDRLEFVADYSLVDGAGDFRKIDYAIESGRFLYGEKQLFEYIPVENEAPPSRELASFKEASFRFLERDEEDKPVWLGEWNIGAGLPKAVLVQIDDDKFIVPLVNR